MARKMEHSTCKLEKKIIGTITSFAVTLTAVSYGLLSSPAIVKAEDGYVTYNGNDYPTELINGNFAYPGRYSVGIDGISVTPTGSSDISAYMIDSVTGKVGWATIGVSGKDAWTYTPDGFDHKKYGWLSNEVNPYAQTMQIECSSENFNYIDMYNQTATSSYQNIYTAPGSIYKWSLKHSSMFPDHDDAMKVLIGAYDGTLSEQLATRVTSNNLSMQDYGNGDIGVIGFTSTTIRTPTDRSAAESPHISNKKTAFDTYTGTYVIPDDQYVTRFSFDAVDSNLQLVGGNELTDIEFSVAYPFYFDANGGSGVTPATGEDAKGVYSNYYAENKKVDLTVAQIASSNGKNDWTVDKLTRDNCTFMGWSEMQYDPFTSLTDAKAVCESEFTGEVNNGGNGICRSGTDTQLNKVYAVWYVSPTPTVPTVTSVPTPAATTESKDTDRTWCVTFLDCKGNTVSVQWVKQGQDAVVPKGFGTYSEYTDVTSHRDLRPSSCAVNIHWVVPDTSDKS